jgi:hypothetical protein
VIIRRIPMNALQKEIFQILSTKQTTSVYDDVADYQKGEDGNPILDDDGNLIPIQPAYPYITLGAFTAKQVGNKTADIYDISQQIHIWSEYEGKKEVNEIANDIIVVLTSWPIDLSADRFNMMSQDVDFFEAFSEEVAGYHGVVTFTAKIQNLGGN